MKKHGKGVNSNSPLLLNLSIMFVPKFPLPVALRRTMRGTHAGDKFQEDFFRLLLLHHHHSNWMEVLEDIVGDLKQWKNSSLIWFLQRIVWFHFFFASLNEIQFIFISKTKILAIQKEFNKVSNLLVKGFLFVF